MVVALVGLLAVAPHAFAAGTAQGSLDPAQMLDQIETVYANAAAPMAKRLESVATDLFVVLAVIEFAYSVGLLVVRGGDLGDWTVELVQQALSIAFLYWLLQNFSGLADDIIRGLQDSAAIAANTAAPNAGNIFASGLNIGTIVLSHMSGWPENWGVDLALGVSGLIIVILYALIAAYILFVIVEAHVAVVIGTLLMGLGPSRWTNSFAMRGINYILSIAAKLFVMEVLVGIGQVIMEQFAAQTAKANIAGDLTLVGASIVFIALVRSIPDIAQGVISGASFASGGALASAISGGAGAMAGAAIGGAAAVSEAAQLASAAGGSGGGGGGEGAGPAGGGGSGDGESGGEAGGEAGGGGGIGAGAMRGARVLGRTAGILARTAKADVRGRIEGDPATRSGRMAGRMARRIRSVNTAKSDGPPRPPML